MRHGHIGWGEWLGGGTACAKVLRQAISYTNKKTAFPTSLLTFCLWDLLLFLNAGHTPAGGSTSPLVHRPPTQRLCLLQICLTGNRAHPVAHTVNRVGRTEIREHLQAYPWKNPVLMQQATMGTWERSTYLVGGYASLQPTYSLGDRVTKQCLHRRCSLLETDQD